MSLAHLRDGPLSARRSERAASLRKRSSKLRALNAITATITQHCGLAPSLEVNFDAIPSPPLTPSESRFLDENDLEKGRYFQDSSLPVTLEAILAVSPFKTPPVEQISNGDRQRDELANDKESATKPAPPSVPNTTDEAKSSPVLAKVIHADAAVVVQSESARANSGPIRPSDVARQHPDHPKTAHLPSKEVQEERLRARRQSRDELRAAQLREAEAPINDVTSSPSSIGGAWSNATPMPADPSPVTSVGEEAINPIESQEKKPHDDQISVIEKSAEQQHHDSLLEAQKELARREILGADIASPDVQLRLEQEQAVKASRDAAAAAPQAPVVALQTEPTFLAPATADLPIDETTTVARPAENINSIPVVPVPEVIIKMEPPQPLQPPHSEPSETSVAAPSTIANSGSLSGDRMSTRVSSGSLREKSLSDAAGEISKIASITAQKLPKSDHSLSPKSKVGKVLNARQQQPTLDADSLQSSSQQKRPANLPIHNEGYEALRGAAEDPAKDYLEPLFRMQTYENLPINKTLSELLARASKVVSTSDQFAGIHERQDHRILRRIYGLQNANKWSLRQMYPLPEPAAPRTHMDHLLSEMKWMRTDFRQERKAKKKIAKYIAEECAEWVGADASERRRMQVNVKAKAPRKFTSNAPHSPAETNFENGEQFSQDAGSPPELESANENDDSSYEDMTLPETPRSPQYIVPRSLILNMNMDERSLLAGDIDDGIHETMMKLPLYVPFDDEPVPTLTQRAVPPVSKFCESKMMTRIPSPMKKRSRFEYEDEDEDDLPPAKRPRAKEGGGLLPEQTDVALFDPENKLLRDRLHSNTAFRPPSEFPMPSSQFYEFRTASQWIAEDEQLLRRLAKDYSFNWSLIADEMSLPSNMSGSADRRTPWECFERWVDLESLPNEMRKTLYFKTWNQRIEAAQRNNDHRYQAQLQAQSQTPNQPQNIVRRRTTPIRVEKRRTNRYLHVVDAMRKNARKREQHAHKQAEAQKAASLRKQHESTAPKSAMHSPAEFSRLRHERDVAMAQRQEQYRQQVLERQRQSAMQQRSGQFAGQQAQPHPGGNQQRPANAAQLQPGQPQQGTHNPQMHPAQQGQAARGTPTAAHSVPQMGMQGTIPQAQMQANMRGVNNANNTTPHASADSIQQRLALEQAHRQAQLKQQQQAQMNGQQFQMGPPNRASPSGLPGSNGVMNGQTNSAMVAAMQPNSSHGTAVNNTAIQQTYSGHASNTNTTAASASPHMPPPPTPVSQQSQQHQPQQLSSGHIPAITQITHQLQAKHPNASPEQIKELTSQHLKQFYSQQQTQQARQSAMHAAAGTHSVVASPAGNQVAYNQNVNQAAFQQNSNGNMATNGHINNSANGASINGPVNGTGQQPSYTSTPSVNGVSPSPNVQYSAAMRQQLIQQRQNQIQSAAMASGSPRVPHASPNMAHASPNMAQAVPNMNGVAAANRTPTPQMSRLGSSGGQPAQGSLQSPGLPQGSPRAVPAGVAQRQ